MRYGISKVVLDSPGFVEIDKTEYMLIKNARENLFEALFLEEKLDLVTETFYEYETELLSMASRIMVFNNTDYFSMSKERNLISRRIVNLLSATEMYLDQGIQHIENMFGRHSANYAQMQAEINMRYDQSLGYRAMEALRNHVKHRGFPIQVISFPQEAIKDGEDFQLLHRVLPLINISALEEDGKFKKSVLSELKNIQTKGMVDARPLIREYVECIGKIHEDVRKQIRADLTQWENIFDDTIIKFQNEFGKDTVLSGLAIIAEEDTGKRTEEKLISKLFIERRQTLETKNSVFVNLHKRFASNEVRKNDP